MRSKRVLQGESTSRLCQVEPLREVMSTKRPQGYHRYDTIFKLICQRAKRTFS